MVYHMFHVFNYITKEFKHYLLLFIMSNNKFILQVHVDTLDQDMLAFYMEHIEKHNKKIADDSPFSDSGFDIFVPENTTFKPGSVTKVNSLIKCCATIDNKPSAFYIYPRSSISKTPLRLANNAGIIDSGYRGPLIGAFDNISHDEYVVEKNTRLLQICAPNLQPIHVEFAASESELGVTNRGQGGFGSTGTSQSYNNNNFNSNNIFGLPENPYLQHSLGNFQSAMSEIEAQMSQLGLFSNEYNQYQPQTTAQTPSMPEDDDSSLEVGDVD